MKQVSTTEEAKRVPYKSVYVPPDNIRKEMGDIEGFSKQLAREGVLEPPIVSNGSSDIPVPDGYDYVLRAGFRRWAAIGHGLSKKEKEAKEVLVVVRKYSEGDALGPVADNWNENMQREGVSPLDLGECLYGLLKGTYRNVIRPYTKEELAERFHLKPNQVGEYSRIFERIHPEVQDLARKIGGPSLPSNTPLSYRQFATLTKLQGEGEDAESREADKLKKQMSAVQKILAQQDALRAAGRQRPERADKGKQRGENKPVLLSSRKVGPSKVKTLRRPIASYLQVLDRKISSKCKQDVRNRLEGMQDAFRFLTGDLPGGRLPEITVEDFKELDAELEAEREAAKAEAKAAKAAAKEAE